jgi:NAD(P)-dependent dehydrogenase (short-subunit alcohol dehydrogenase family)
VVFGGRQLRDVLLVTGRRPGPIEETIAEHANIAGLVADAASAEDAKRTIAKAVDIWGRVDSLVNNAGAGAILPLADTTADRVMDIFAVNVLGPSLPRLCCSSSPQSNTGHGRQCLKHRIIRNSPSKTPRSLPVSRSHGRSS